MDETSAATTLGREDWDSLVRRHHRSVVLSLLALRIPFERAGELAQAAWVKLMENHRAGKLPELRLPGLAIVQARFLALEERRRDSAAQRRESETPAATLAADRLDPERRLLSKEQAQRALEVVARCPPSTQKLFRLLYRDPRMPHAEAAVELGLSVQRVRQIVCELRKQVRAAVEEKEP